MQNNTQGGETLYVHNLFTTHHQDCVENTAEETL